LKIAVHRKLEVTKNIFSLISFLMVLLSV